MLVKAIEGVVENGKIRLRENVALPDNTRVYVIVAEPAESAAVQVRTPHLAHAEQAKDFRKQIMAGSNGTGTRSAAVV